MSASVSSPVSSVSSSSVVPPLAAVAHELRTPLHGMLGLVALLGETALDAEQRAHVALLAESAQTLLRFADDALALARLDGDPLARVRLAPCDVRAVLASLVRTLAPLAARGAVALTADAAPAVPATVRTDAGWLRQILVNLVGNALKHTRRGSVRVHARLDGAWLAVDVIDTGVGLTPAHRARLFRAWDRSADALDAPDAPDGQGAPDGAGIGLVLAAELARRLGGRIAVESTHGVGSTFTVWHPLNIAGGVADTGAQEQPAGGCPPPEPP